MASSIRAEVRRPHYNVTFVVLSLGIASYALLQSLVVPVLPTIQQHLHATQTSVTWVMTAYLLSAAVATPILGRIGDVVGKERMLLVALIALGAGSLLAAFTTSISVMIAARVIQGLGGGVMPLAFGIIRDEFPREKVASAIGMAAALIAVGGGIALVLAGPILDTFGYKWLFLIPAVVTALAAIATKLVVPESPIRTKGHISISGALLLTGWLVALLVPISEGEVWGWTSARVLGLLGLAVVLIIAWIVVEWRSAEPLVDLRMMRIPAVWTTNLVALLIGIVMYSVMTFLPQFLQTPKAAGYGFTASITKSGVFLLPMTIMMFFAGLLTGRLSERIGAKSVLALGSAFSALSLGLLAARHDQQWEIYVVAGLAGLGIGLAFSAMSAIIVTIVSAEQTGVASGMNANIRTIGGSIGTAVMGSVVTSGAVNGLPKESGYSNGFWLLAIVAVAAIAASLVIPRTRRRVGIVSEVEPASASVAALPPRPSVVPLDSVARQESIVRHRATEQALAGRIVDGIGRPLAASVVTVTELGGRQLRRVRVGNDGRYEITDLAPGSYTLIVVAAGYAPQALSVVVDPHRAANHDFRLIGVGAVAGQVRLGGGEATVVITDATGQVVGQTVTDRGDFVLDGLPAGAVTITAQAPGHRPAATQANVAPGDAVRVEVTLAPTGELAGVVRSPGGQPLPDAVVTVIAADGEVAGVANTDSAGRYQLDNLAAGDYTVVANVYGTGTALVSLGTTAANTVDVLLPAANANTVPTASAHRTEFAAAAAEPAGLGQEQ